ncbi:MAG: hypothetical protein ACLTAX_01260 [Waltera sp.]
MSDQQETYNETLEKWNEFSTYIDGNAVCARYNGVITGVELGGRRQDQYRNLLWLPYTIWTK